MGLLYAFGEEHSVRPIGAGVEGGVGERGGDFQRQQLLHVPRGEEALLRDGREPNGVRAGPGPKRQRD